MYKFDVKDATEKCIEWIQKFFEENGPSCNAVLGISGGKDSSVVAALCVKALGKDRVIGVLMPNGEQYDIVDSYGICDFLDIKRYVINIKDSGNVTFVIDGNKTVKTGGNYRLDYKLMMLEATISELAKSEAGTIDLSVEGQALFSPEE